MRPKILMFRDVWIFAIFSCVFARIHKLEIRDDNRRLISLSTFGFYKGGILSVNFTNFKPSSFNENDVFGFSLDRTFSDAMNPYLDSHQEKCLLYSNHSIKSDLEPRDDSSVIYFVMDFKNLILRVNCSSRIQKLHISPYYSMRTKRTFLTEQLSDIALFPRRRRTVKKTEVVPEKIDDVPSDVPSTVCNQIKLPIRKEERNKETYYNTSFALFIVNDDEEGLYNLYYHNCHNYNYQKAPVSVEFTMHVIEKNADNFLSAGEIPLPKLYFLMAFLFFSSGCLWVHILRTSKQPVYKIHYLMAILTFLKSASLLFHGINYHFIELKGEHVAAWAILYYITHLLKGSVLFITIVLIGTGWTFIKHILSDRDKKLFMIAIPLQVLAYVADIIIEESEEGDIEHETWKDIFILVDLLCCGAIMVPVVWSIRYLQQAAHTDGVAAINLKKLKLFRHFYMMILCYIYFTRIIAYLLKITVPFQYEWLDELFHEMATYIFFFLTGYKFRPASTNPYFMLTTEELDQNFNDDDTDVVLFSSISSGSGLMESMNKVSKVKKIVRPKNVESTNEENDNLVGKMESSHDYD